MSWEGKYAGVSSYNAIDDPTCGECKNLPSCFGGCRWAAMKQKGDYSAFQCSGSFFEHAVPSLLMMEAGVQTPNLEVSDESSKEKQAS